MAKSNNSHFEIDGIQIQFPIETVIDVSHVALFPLPEMTAEEERAEALANAEIDMQIALPKSVVPRGYKLAYKAKANARGDRGKAPKRSVWDWTAQRMAEIVLTDKQKLDVEAFEALMAANGVNTANWTSRTNGWEGRLRMTGGIALRRKLAETGLLAMPDGSIVQMPEADFAALVAKFSL